MSTTVDADISMSSTLDNGMSLSGLVSLTKVVLTTLVGQFLVTLVKLLSAAQPTTASVQQTLA